MTDRPIPALDDETYPIRVFHEDLALWCDQYVDEVAFPIMRRANDLYEDHAIVALVCEWSRLKRQRNGQRLDALMASANADAYVSKAYKLWDRDREGIDTALRILLIGNDKED